MSLAVEGVRPRFLGLVWACVYTGKTPDQLEHAHRKGLLPMCYAADGSRSFDVVDLDKFMVKERIEKKPPAPERKPGKKAS